MPKKYEIESIIRRDGGTRVTIGRITYHFKPRPDGAHVAEVETPEHIRRFLAIPEGYRLYDPELVDEPAPEPEPEPEPVEPLVSTEPAPAAPAPAEVSDDDAEPLPSLEGMTRADLEATFLREVGRVAKPQHKDETLINQIVAVRMDKAAGGA